MNFYSIVERAKWCYRTLSFFLMDGVKKTVLRLVLPRKDRAFLSVSLREEEEGARERGAFKLPLVPKEKPELAARSLSTNGDP
jgi:hypothetical protein